MVWFDQKLQRVIVRVVYDGPAHAGKSTNVRQLAAAFTPLRRGELIAPEQRDDGRTLFFDWLRIDGGLIAGHALRCQLVTSPGQSMLAHRRWHLVATADVVVFVCDSTPEGLRDGRRSLEMLRARYCDSGHGPTLVVQANKQDAEGALPPEQVALALDLGPDIPVLAAQAVAGIGVRETAVVAIRAAADIAQRLVLTKGIEALEPPDEGADALLANMKGLAAARPRKLRRGERSAQGLAFDGTTLPLPHANLPDGCIWPAARGRAILETLELAYSESRMERKNDRNPRLVYRVGDLQLEPSASAYEDDASAREAMSALARKKIRLGDLCAKDTALAITASPDGRFWVWTIAPALPDLEDIAGSPERAELLGRALAVSLRAAYTSSVALIADPAWLAKTAEGFAYFGEITLDGEPLKATLDSMLECSSRATSSAADFERTAAAFWRAASSDPHFGEAVRRELESFAAENSSARSSAANRWLALRGPPSGSDHQVIAMSTRSR